MSPRYIPAWRSSIFCKPAAPATSTHADSETWDIFETEIFKVALAVEKSDTLSIIWPLTLIVEPLRVAL